MAVILLVKTEDGKVVELPILEKMVIGRSNSCDLKIDDVQISGSHCSFEMTPKGQLLFKDLGSTNGSFLNNTQIKETLLKVGDVVRIGITEISVDEKKLNPSEKNLFTSTVNEADLSREVKRPTIRLGKTQELSSWSKRERKVDPEAPATFLEKLEIVAKKKK